MTAVTLVMAARDAEAHIGEALASAGEEKRSGTPLEVVVADGGSRDMTRQIAGDFPFARVLEGGDDSIYEGFNRGIDAAQGEIIGFLNADDRLAPGALAAVLSCFGAHPRPLMVSGGVASGSWQEGGADMPGPVRCHENAMSVPGLLFGVPAINGRFFRRELLAETGGFVPEAGLGADREFLLRLLKRSGAAPSARACIAQPLYHYRVHEGSRTISGSDRARAAIRKAELDLADYLLGADYLDGGEVGWVRRLDALARLKLRLTPSSGEHCAAASLTAEHIRHLPAALVAWRRWRCRLSGY